MTGADLVLVGGRVRTLDPGLPSATAVAVAGGEILAVGSDAEIRELRGAGCETVDLRGAAVTPGLVDSHSHVLPGPRPVRGADLLDARSLDEVRAAIAAERARTRPGDWVFGWGVSYDAFAGTAIHAELIEEAAGGAPVVLRFFDVHTTLASRAALERAGIRGPRAFEEHAEVVCVDGVPTGELREAAAMALVEQAAPAPTPDDLDALAVTHLRGMAAHGVTGTHRMDGDVASLGLLRELEARGDLAIRVLGAFHVTPEAERAAWEDLAAHRDEHGARWRAGVAKFFIDGVIDSGTGWLVTPDSQGQGTLPFWPDPGRYREAVAFFARRGFQCVTHACGDRAVREALDAYRAAGAAPGIRHRVEHIETLQPDDLPRFAAEGVVPSMQAQHMMGLDPGLEDNWSRRLGPERCARAFPIASLLRSGALPALGSDWPVARYDPRVGMAAARLRRPPGATGREPYDDEAIDALSALQGYTTWAARAVGEGDRRGRVRPGMAADLTVWGEDPVDCAADDLPEDPVLLTVVDGELVHRDAAL